MPGEILDSSDLALLKGCILVDIYWQPEPLCLVLVVENKSEQRQEFRIHPVSLTKTALMISTFEEHPAPVAEHPEDMEEW